MQCSGELLHSWSHTAPCSARYRASRPDFPYKETPLPFTVLAMMTLGLPLTVFARAKPLRWLSKSCPSMVCTSKPKASNFLSIGFRAGNFADRAVNLQAVEVDNQAEIIQVVVGCKHSSFPNLTLFNLAIAEQRVNTVNLCYQSCRQAPCLPQRKCPDREKPELISMPGVPLISG